MKSAKQAADIDFFAGAACSHVDAASSFADAARQSGFDLNSPAFVLRSSVSFWPPFHSDPGAV
jgi:hypothetical protein